MRIGIIGGGPRALWAVELLVSLARRPTAPHIIIDLWDPQDPGAGWVYRADQPLCWRLNAPASIVTTAAGDLTDWMDERGLPKENFPPRAVVGQFLSESWGYVVASAPDNVQINHRKQKVETVDPAEGGRWVINGGEEVDRLLIATGHARQWDGALSEAEAGTLVVRPYGAPGLETIGAGDRVCVRGAALTFIDVCLALTEGRGGRFMEQAGAGAGAGTSGLRYEPSGEEPAEIVVYSRSGRFMEVKPEPGSALHNLPIPSVEALSDEIRGAKDVATIRRALTVASGELLTQAGGSADAAASADIAAVLDGTDGSDDPVRDLRRSLDVVRGLAQPSAAWAVGEAWRRLYPAIVERMSYRHLDGFAELARRLERVGFGPPAVTSARVLALIDEGLVRVADGPSVGEEPSALDTVDVTVDAVIPPPGVQPGTIVADLVARGVIGRTSWGTLDLNRDATVPGHPSLAVIGRDAEGTVLGHDTLNRTMHPELKKWSAGVMTTEASHATPQAGMHGTPPLTARLEPWMERLAANPAQVAQLVADYDSPVNVLYPQVLPRNAAELVDAGAERGVDVRVFFARKANKGLSFVDAARDAGHGVDVASERELLQVLDRGVAPEKMILSAAVKPERLLNEAVRAGVPISVDNVAELRAIQRIARELGVTAPVVPRVAPDPAVLPPTRFGELAGTWQEVIDGLPTEGAGTEGAGVRIVGVHMHLHGYSASDRRVALADAVHVVDAATSAGHVVEFIDLGGGVPMSYLDSDGEWETFQQRIAEQRSGGSVFTWKADPLTNVYPFRQSPVRGQWLGELLDGAVPGLGTTAADALRSRNLRLHMEPGRSILDGGGVIVARVAFVKQRSDGENLVGLEMNRTQCRTTADDILVDPLLVRAEGVGADDPFEGFLVGAYCIEDEVIVRRRMVFPQGVCPGDFVLIPNTAGYFMHILESASHQIPLAKNVWIADDGDDATIMLDDIDA